MEELDWSAHSWIETPSDTFGMNWSTDCVSVLIPQQQCWTALRLSPHSQVLKPAIAADSCSLVLERDVQQTHMAGIYACPHTFGQVGHKRMPLL